MEYYMLYEIFNYVEVNCRIGMTSIDKKYNLYKKHYLYKKPVIRVNQNDFNCEKYKNVCAKYHVNRVNKYFDWNKYEDFDIHYFRIEYDFVGEIIDLPKTVKILVLNNVKKAKIIKIPESVEILMLGNNFDERIDKFPENLREIHTYCNYEKKKCKIPKNIKVINRPLYNYH